MRQMRISEFIFVSVTQPQKFGIKQMMGKTRQAKPIPLRAHINSRNSWDRLTADFRQETHTQVMRKADAPTATSANYQQ